jgi:hypothetical protein
LWTWLEYSHFSTDTAILMVGEVIKTWKISDTNFHFNEAFCFGCEFVYEFIKCVNDLQTTVTLMEVMDTVMVWVSIHFGLNITELMAYSQLYVVLNIYSLTLSK